MMILLKGPNGLRRVEEGTPYRKLAGEVVVGSEADAVDTEMNDVLEKEGMGLGDFIEKSFKLLPEKIRPKHCTKCEKRKLVLNRVKDIGWVQAIKQIREIKE
jgi:hypothetical protein